MNIIIYNKQNSDNSEFSEYVKNRTSVNVQMAQSAEEVINSFVRLKDIDKLVIVDISIPSDLGLIQFVKTNHPFTKIMVYASPIIRQSIEIIKDMDIELSDCSLEEIKKIPLKIIDPKKNEEEK